MEMDYKWKVGCPLYHIRENFLADNDCKKFKFVGVKEMKLTNEMILSIAMKQSAVDANCSINDFLCTKNVITISKENPSARKYLKLYNGIVN